jgi:hypothetical protein
MTLIFLLSAALFGGALQAVVEVSGANLIIGTIISLIIMGVVGGIGGVVGSAISSR